MSSRSLEPVRLGVIGLGRAFMLTLPTIHASPLVELVAACDVRKDARDTFEHEFRQPAFDNIDSLCGHSDIEAVYVASPHELHYEHVISCAMAGKHVLVEKPLSISLDEGQRMIQACRNAGVHLIVGPSHSFDPSVGQARVLIEGRSLGSVRMIHALNYTDFLYRPRRREELHTEHGGGVIFSQAIHQVDMVRVLAGQTARYVVAMTGAWDPDRPTEGAYGALISFDNGLFASLMYSGYGHFDSDVWQGWVGELGQDKDPSNYGSARRVLANIDGSVGESSLKANRTYGRSRPPAGGIHGEHFGPVIISCENGDIRLTPDGLWVYDNHKFEFLPGCSDDLPRSTVIESLVSAVRDNQPPLQTGEWGLASLEICHGILESSRSGSPFVLQQQSM